MTEFFHFFAQSSTDLTRLVIAMISYTAGFAAIPIVIRSFSGAFQTITGRINDRSRGFFDRTQNNLRAKDQGIKDRRRERRVERAQARQTELGAGFGRVDQNGNRQLGIRGVRNSLGRTKARFTTGQLGENTLNRVVRRSDAEAQRGLDAQASFEARSKIDTARRTAAIQAEAQYRETAGKNSVIAANPEQAMEQATLNVREASIKADTWNIDTENQKLDAAQIGAQAENQERAAYRAASAASGIGSGNLDADRAQIEAQRKINEASLYRQDIAESGVEADAIKQKAQTTAFDQYRRDSGGRNLIVNQAEDQGMATEIAGKTYNQAANQAGLALEERGRNIKNRVALLQQSEQTMPRNDYLNFVADQGSNPNASEADVAASAQILTQNRAYEQLTRMQSNIRNNVENLSKQRGVSKEKVREEASKWNKSQGELYSDLGDISSSLQTTISVDVDPSSGSVSVGDLNEINSRKLANFHDASLDAMSKHDADALEDYINLATVTGTLDQALDKFERVTSNERLVQNMKGPTLSYMQDQLNARRNTTNSS